MGLDFDVCAFFCCSVWCCIEVTVTSNSPLPLTAIDSLTVQTNDFSDCMSLRGPLRQTNCQTNVLSFSDSGSISRRFSVDMRQAVAGGQHDSEFAEFNARRSRRVVSQSFETLWTCSYNGNSLKPADCYRSPHNSPHPRPGCSCRVFTCTAKPMALHCSFITCITT